MTQSVKSSAVEVVVSTTIGWVVALLSQVLIFPLFNIEVSTSTNIQISIIFTAVSIIRGFAVRRLFNYIGK